MKTNCWGLQVVVLFWLSLLSLLSYGNEAEEEMIERFLEARREGDMGRVAYSLHRDSLSHFREILTALHGQIAEQLEDAEFLWEATGFEVVPDAKQVSDVRFFRLCVECLEEEDQEDLREWKLMALAEGENGESYAALKASDELYGVSTQSTKTWTMRFEEGEPKFVNVFYHREVAKLWIAQARELKAAAKEAEGEG